SPTAAPVTARDYASSRRGAEAGQAAALPAVGVEITRVEPGLEGSAQGGPLPVHNRKPRRVAVVAAGDHRLSEQPLIKPSRVAAARLGRLHEIAFPFVAAVAK